MPIGVIIDAMSVVIGGLLGAVVRKYVKEEWKENLTLIMGVCSMGMGISTLILIKNMSAVILAIVIGTMIGLILRLGLWIDRGAIQMQKIIARLIQTKSFNESSVESTYMLVTAIVLFSASGLGIYGALIEGMTGDPSILISKAILDVFTAMIFSCTLGPVISMVAVPQVLVLFILYILARFIYPLTTPDMILDFKACGGFLVLATGLRMAKIKDFPIADMIPAMALVMIFSHWMN